MSTPPPLNISSLASTISFKTPLYDDWNSTNLSNLSNTTYPTTPRRYDEHGLYLHPHWDQYRDIIDEAPAEFMTLLGIYITLVAFIGTFGNIIVLYVFGSTPSLKTPSNIFVINLAICDLMFSAIIGFPMMALACFRRYWMWGFFGCQWYAFVAGVSGLVSINTLTAISVDRYMVIAKPMYMLHAASKSRSIQQIVFVWIHAVCWVSAPWFGWGAFMLEGFGFSCTWDYLTQTWNNISFNMCFVFFQFIVPVSLILICYVGIISAVAKNRKEMTRMTKETANATKQEIQIAKVVAVNVIMFIITWVPYVTVAMLGVAGHSQFVTPYTTEIPVMLAKASGAWNPIIYALSHPRYRDALRKSKLPFRYCLGKPTKSEVSAANTRMSEMSSSGSVREGKTGDNPAPAKEPEVPTIELHPSEPSEGAKAEGGSASPAKIAASSF